MSEVSLKSIGTRTFFRLIIGTSQGAKGAWGARCQRVGAKGARCQGDQGAGASCPVRHHRCFSVPEVPRLVNPILAYDVRALMALAPLALWHPLAPTLWHPAP